jgi:hypothetical protein
MTTTLILNLVGAVLIVAALAAVCRFAYHAADGLLDTRPRTEAQPDTSADERLAA